MSAAIVLDKSFLQGSKGSRIQELAKLNRLLVSDALFYELLTCPEPDRSKCFAKFPAVDNPVDLVSHIGTLMRLEFRTHKPSGRPSAHREQIHFRFNPQLISSDYVLPAEARAAVEEKRTQLQSDVTSFLERVDVIPSFFPDLLKGSDNNRKAAYADAERAIAKPGALIPFYSALEPPPGEEALPNAELVSEHWAIYRWLQVQLLFALDVFVRYRGAVTEALNPITYEKMEHDVLDAQVFMLGCLEGAFATQEKKLKRWWALLCPDGDLYE